MARLPISLVDILVKVGLNDLTGLCPVPVQQESQIDHENELFTTAFEPEILAAISADAAVFPQEEIVSYRLIGCYMVFRVMLLEQDDSYPPNEQTQKVETKKRLQSMYYKEHLQSLGNGYVNDSPNNKGKITTNNAKKGFSFRGNISMKQKKNKHINDINSNNNQLQPSLVSYSSTGQPRKPLHKHNEQPESVYPNLTVVSSVGGWHENIGNHSVPPDKVSNETPTSSPLLVRNKSIRKSFRSVDLARKSNSLEGKDRKIRREDLPLSADALNSLTSMCFPEGAYCYSVEPRNSVHFLVLTDIHGIKSYAICLTYYRPFKAELEDENKNSWICHSDVTPNGDESSNHVSAKFQVLNEDQFQCFLPSCLVIISKFPYYSLLKDCLSRLSQNLNENRGEEDQILKEFALQFTRIPVPPTGNLAIEFSYAENTFMLWPQNCHDRSVIDFSLNQVFEHLSPDKVLLILNCLLLQHRVVFISSHLSILTVICESFLHLMYPFRWQFTFVPILSWSMLELTEAPGTFIMGCHSRHRDMIEQVEDIVLVGLDEGGVSFIGEVDVPKIPQSYADGFLNSCQTALEMFNSAVLAIGSPTLFQYEQIKKEEHTHQQQFNAAILNAALELMVDLFRDVARIFAEKRFFNKEKFLFNVRNEEKVFYEQVMSTELFNAFLKDRMSHKKDQWTYMEEKERTLYKGPVTSSNYDLLNRRRSSMVKVNFSRSKSLPANDYQQLSSGSDPGQSGGTKIALSHVKLPEFYYYSHETYHRDCSEKVDTTFHVCTSSQTRAPFYYLLGMLNYADGQNIEALQQFQRLETCDSRLLPGQLIREITELLSENEKSELHQNSVVFHRGIRYTKNEHTHHRPVTVTMHFNKIPNIDMDLRTFTDTVQYLEIAMDQETIARLFKALLLLDAGIKQKVVPQVFELFYKSWKEQEMKSKDINSNLESHLEAGECVLKISDTIKCSVGSGRIGLTQKRLFYMRDGPQSYKEVVTLRDVMLINKIENKSFFTKLESISLDIKGNVKPFIADLKDQRDLWYNIIKEMWAGKLCSEEVRDPFVIQLAAQNVLILDAFMQCMLEMTVIYHYVDWKEKVKSLCYYSTYKDENVYGLTAETKEALQHRIDPNILEQERLSIECMVYTPGNRSEGGNYDSDPKLWCAFSNGKIRIFNASTWVMDMAFIKVNSKVSNLLTVGLNYIWVACFDNEIHIIDIGTKSSNQALKGHTDAVAGLTKNTDESVVYSCSLNNEIIAWDTSSFQYTIISSDRDRSSYVRNIQYYNDYLFCGTKEEILLFSNDGQLQHRLVHCDRPSHGCHSNAPVQLDCYVLTPNSEIWIGCGRMGLVLIYDLATLDLKKQIPIDNTTGISKMVLVNNKVWIGTKDGRLFVYDSIAYVQNKLLVGHKEAIRSMCAALDRYVITGSGSKEGKIMIWRASTVY